MRLHLRAIIGVRNVPLAYVVRKLVGVVAEGAPILLDNQPHSEEHGSVEEELVLRTFHTHPLYRNDNNDVYVRI